MTTANSAKNGTKEELTFKAIHEQAPTKPGVVFWIGPVGETFFWRDLLRVSYDPSPGDDEPDERITMLFRLSDIVIQGHGLRDVYLHCQTCRLDWIKISSQSTIMIGNPPLVIGIHIKKPKKD